MAACVYVGGRVGVNGIGATKAGRTCAIPHPLTCAIPHPPTCAIAHPPYLRNLPPPQLLVYAPKLGRRQAHLQATQGHGAP